MIDIHTHILPRMDDGAKDVEMSLAMLRMEQEQGVKTVVLTPHFYREQETPRNFLARRQTSFDMLQSAVQNQHLPIPQLVLGAEVAWVPHMSQWEELPQLCLGDSSYLLLELPFSPWKSGMIQDIYNMILDQDITPVFAHLERYVKIQNRKYIHEILAMETPIQVSAEPLLHLKSRRTAWNIMQQAHVGLLGSDCHNLTTRPPNLKAGIDVVRRLQK